MHFPAFRFATALVCRPCPWHSRCGSLHPVDRVPTHQPQDNTAVVALGGDLKHRQTRREAGTQSQESRTPRDRPVAPRRGITPMPGRHRCVVPPCCSLFSLLLFSVLRRRRRPASACPPSRAATCRSPAAAHSPTAPTRSAARSVTARRRVCTGRRASAPRRMTAWAVRRSTSASPVDTRFRSRRSAPRKCARWQA